MNQQINQDQQYNPTQQIVLPQDQMNRPNYDYSRDIIPSYGSIIKDLTDTKDMLDLYELRLRGKKKDASGKIVFDEGGTERVKTDRAARDFVDIIRGVVNRHNDFSYYDEKDSNAIIMGANYTICRWLMFQGDEVPLRYRYKISFEAMSMIFSSTHKAIGGKMLLWTKGTFNEGMNHSGESNQKKGIMDYIFPFRRRHVGG